MCHSAGWMITALFSGIAVPQWYREVHSAFGTGEPEVPVWGSHRHQQPSTTIQPQQQPQSYSRWQRQQKQQQPSPECCREVFEWFSGLCGDAALPRTAGEAWEHTHQHSAAYSRTPSRASKCAPETLFTQTRPWCFCSPRHAPGADSPSFVDRPSQPGWPSPPCSSGEAEWLCTFHGHLPSKTDWHPQHTLRPHHFRGRGR